MSPETAGGLIAVAIWAWLLVFRNGFWRADQRLGEAPPDPDSWPGVVAVVPARDEAATVGAAVASLLGQSYPGALSVVVVDDASTDGTAEAARGADAGSGFLRVIEGAPLEAGWTGKLWAVEQGLREADRTAPEAEYVLFTDADIEHHPGNLLRLVAKARSDGLDLVSLMALLRCESPWERLLIPAFVFFFQKLFPFPRVNDPNRATAAAAGGCMLVRRAALERAGGIRAIRGRLIDDCALAALIKPHGPIWLGLSERTRSIRAYDRLADIWNMVARTAYEQLGCSPAALGGTVIGMAAVYLLGPAAVVAGVVAGDGAAVSAGLSSWLLMWIAYRPTSRLYRQAPWRILLLPVAAVLFTLMTIDSAFCHWRGRGGAWKGRKYSG